jgi:hypothetical protein
MFSMMFLREAKVDTDVMIHMLLIGSSASALFRCAFVLFVSLMAWMPKMLAYIIYSVVTMFDNIRVWG